MKPLGLGAIGSGEIAINSIFKHLVLGDTADKVYMAAVCDPVPGRAQAMAEQYGIKNWYMTDDELLADPNVDVVSICSPIRFHYEQGLKAIRAGKHVHFNKTMAMTSEEATELIEEAKRMNVKITSSPGMMAMPVNREMRRLVAENKLGHITYAVGGVRGVLLYHLREGYRQDNCGSEPLVPTWYYKKPDGGPQYDHAIYGLTAMTGILGPVKRVSCMGGQIMKEFRFGKQVIESEVDDNFAFLLDFGENVYGLFYSALAGGENKMTPAIYGTEGKFVDGKFNDEVIFDTPVKGMMAKDLPIEHLKMHEPFVYRDVMELIDYVHGLREPVATAEQGRHVLEIIEAGFESMKTGRVVELKTDFTPLTAEQLRD